MNAARMNYDYSTKNFHRYVTVNGGVPKELYVPRSEMAQPVAEITTQITVSAPMLVLEKVKPAKS